MIPNRFIADLLISAGVIDRAAIAQVAEAQPKNCATLGRALAGLGLADEAVVAAAIASALHLDYFDVQATEPGANVAKLLPAEFCRKRRVAPVRLDGHVLTLAVADPMDDAVVQDVRFRTGKNTIAVVATETGLEQLCGRMYPELKADDQASAYNILQGVNPSGEVEASGENEYELIDPETLAKDTKLPPIVRLVNLILSDAAAAGASDVHIEPQETLLQVRHRVDGQLRDVLTIPAHLKDQTISRLKIMSGMDIAERRKPQDGRSRLRFEGRRIDLRVSTLPTQFGEKIVIRLLNSDRGIQPLDQIGLSPDNLKTMRKFLSHPQGLVLVTGPTGSGKTSTLLHRAQVDQVVEQQHHHAGRPDRAAAAGRQSDPDQRQGRADVYHRPAIDSPAGSERHSGRRNPRSRDGGHRAAGGADRPPPAEHAAHQRRPVDAHQAVRSRHPAVSRRVVHPRHRRPASGAASVPGLRRARTAERRDD